MRRVAGRAWPGERPAPTFPRTQSDARSTGRPVVHAFPSAYPEIDCVRHLLPQRLAAAAERRADALGVGADRALIAAGAIDEEFYLRAFAARFGVAFERLDRIDRFACPLDDQRLLRGVAAGIIPLRVNGEIVWVIAPRVMAARSLARLLAPRPDLRRRIRVASSACMRDFALRHTAAALGKHAADALRHALPDLSSAPREQRPPRRALLATLGLLAAAFAFAPAETFGAASVVLSFVFLLWIVLRLVSLAVRRLGGASAARIDDLRLPVYTIICPLYREAASVEGLVAALRTLDYPAEKLQTILLVERDDETTRAAIERLRLPSHFEVLTVPDAGPRTKPKALNAALPFVRGAFIVIYDAEDRPEADQLRVALSAFRAGGARLGCVQARLTIDNTADSWLTRMFTAEYAGQFDVFLPGLAALRLPFPLGGSSNHFRTETLRGVGAWDPYNVTEDADLGMRLARFGYRTAVADSTTFEEAPARFDPWLRQRTRWLKGWMQTWMVHVRKPSALLRDLGPGGTLTFALVVGGNVLAPLVYPVFIASLAYAALSDTALAGLDNPLVATLLWLYAATLAAGLTTSVALGMFGLKKRGLLHTAWVLLLTPVHWLLLSLAAWRALFQLVSDPYRWEKTEHGLARTSRLLQDKARPNHAPRARV